MTKRGAVYLLILVMSLSVAVIANASDAPLPEPGADTSAVPVSTVRQLVLPRFKCKIVTGNRVCEQNALHTTYALLVEWDVGPCATLEEGTFHSATVVSTPDGWVLTLRAKGAKLIPNYNPYGANNSNCLMKSTHDDQIVPLPSKLGNQKLLDGFCAEPVKCPIYRGWKPAARQTIRRMRVV